MTNPPGNFIAGLKKGLLEDELFSRKWTSYRISGKRLSEEHPDEEISDYNSVVLAYHEKDVYDYIVELINEHKERRIFFIPTVSKVPLDFKDGGLAEIVLQEKKHD